MVRGTFEETLDAILDAEADHGSGRPAGSADKREERRDRCPWLVRGIGVGMCEGPAKAGSGPHRGDEGGSRAATGQC